MLPVNKKIFFSYATVAPMGAAAYQAASVYFKEFYEFGPPDALWKYDPLSAELSKEAAQLLNCDPDEITFISNTTEGINHASDALPLEKGDEILVLANEYPANFLPWIRKRQDGIKVTVVGGTDNLKSTEELVKAINPNTKAIAISSAQYYDGYMVDLGRISDICRLKNIFLIVDAVQSIGVRKIDLQATAVDFLVCGGQKYLQAGPGNGFMYVNKNILSKIRNPRVGIRSMSNFDERGFKLKDSAERFQGGTQNLPGIVSLNAALHHVNSIGIDIIEARNIELLKKIKTCLNDHSIAFIDHGDHQSNIVSIKVADPQGLVDYLKDHNAYIKVIKDVARMSFAHTTTMEDVETLVELISAWLKANSLVDSEKNLIAA